MTGSKNVITSLVLALLLALSTIDAAPSAPSVNVNSVTSSSVTLSWSTASVSSVATSSSTPTASSSATDNSGNHYTIVNGQVALNGAVDSSTANVAGLLYYSNTIYHVNTAGKWYGKTSTTGSWSGGGIIPPAAGMSTGFFYSKDGQMYDPDGQMWFGRGANIIDGNANAVINNAATGAPLLTTLPGTNVVRWPCSSYQQPSYYDSLVNALAAHKVVVILENHQNFNADGSPAGGAGGSQGVILTGNMLNTETNWYSNIASHFKSNPYVWFGTNNEPSENDPWGGSDPNGLSSWQQTTYNAIRATGNNAPILVEAMCDRNFANGYVNSNMNNGIYKQMTNIVWDFHIYNWIFVDGNGNDINNLQQQTADVQKIINLLQSNWQSMDGIPAVFCGEYGPSTSDQLPMDNGGMTLVQAVENLTGNGKGKLCGNCAWDFFKLWDGAADYLTNYDGSLSSPYGTTVAAWIKSASQSAGTTSSVVANIQGVLRAGAGGSLKDNSGNSWTITSGGQVAVNGATDTSTAGVVMLAYVGGIMWQENGNNMWWGKSSPSDSWSPDAGQSSSPLTGTTTVYQAQYRTSGSSSWSYFGAATTASSATITNLQSGTGYDFAVTAISGSGSTTSSVVTATPSSNSNPNPTAAPTARPTSKPAGTSSASGTVVTGTSGSITDASGNVWTITSDGRVAVNGVTDTSTAGVIELAYVSGIVWQENANKMWWGKSSPSSSWSPNAGTSVSPISSTAAPTSRPSTSSSGTVVSAGSNQTIRDAAGNVWTITSGGKIAVNGVTDNTTGNVIKIAYVNGVLWQENSNNLWWGKASAGASWLPNAGTSVSPV